MRWHIHSDTPISSASYAVSALSLHSPHDAHWLSRGVKSSPNKATASLIRKCCCNANQIIPLYKFRRYSSSRRRIGSEIVTSLLEILAVWENARCSRTICIHQRDGGIRLFLARVEAVVATNERTVRTRGSNIHCKFAWKIFRVYVTALFDHCCAVVLWPNECRLRWRQTCSFVAWLRPRNRNSHIFSIVYL